MPDNSFDIVSIVEMPEVINAINQAMKEITVRYDLKDSKSDIQLNEKDKKITISTKDEFSLKAVVEIFQGKLVKRKVSETDRRQVEVHLLKTGEQLLLRLAELHRAELRSLTSSFRVPQIDL